MGLTAALKRSKKREQSLERLAKRVAREVRNTKTDAHNTHTELKRYVLLILSISH